MVDITQLVQMAKDTIKKKFGEEMDVEIVPLDEVPKWRAKLSEQRDERIPDDFDGLFSPAKNGHNAFLLVGYNTEFDLFEKYHHELQHAVDYFILMKTIGELPQCFEEYTEYSAGLEGFFRYNMAVLSMMKTDAVRQKFLVDAKAQLAKGFETTPSTIFDMLCYLARVSAFGRIEGRLDPKLYAGVPERVVELANFIRHYEPTRKWYAEFKKRIESIPVKEEPK